MNARRFKVASLFVILAVAAYACTFGFSTANVKDAKLSKRVNEKSEPVDPTTTFDSGDSVIHCVVQLANAPDNTKVKARWIAVKVEGLEPNQKLIDKDIDAGGSNNTVDFTLTPPATGFQPGEYKVDIYLNPKSDREDQPARSLPFTVMSSGPAIASAMLSTEPEGESPVTSFQPDTEKIYCRVKLRTASPGATVTAKWIAVQTDVTQPNYEIASSPLVLSGAQNIITFHLSKPDAGFPPGQYRVDLYLNNESAPAKSLPFTVSP